MCHMKNTINLVGKNTIPFNTVPEMQLLSTGYKVL